LQVQAATCDKLDLSAALRAFQEEGMVRGYRGFTQEQLQEGISLGKDAPWLKDNSRPAPDSSSAAGTAIDAGHQQQVGPLAHCKQTVCARLLCH
jgi:hypothetical protein